MSTPLTDAINALTTYANETTGASDTTLSAAVGTLAAGYGSGDVEDFGADVSFNIAQLFHRISTGDYVSGEFTLSNYLPNTATTVVSTGLSTVHGFFYVDCTDSGYYTQNTPDFGIMGYYQTDGTNTYHFCLVKNRLSVNTKSLVIRGSYTFSGGNFVVTAQYNINYSYTPFYKNHVYKWIAW